MNDPIVNEIRMFRDEHAKSFNYDTKAICDDYRQKHSLYVEKLAQIKRQENANKSVQRVRHEVVDLIVDTVRRQ